MKIFNNSLKNTIENKITNVVTHPDLDLYVTWPSLENSLKGIKDALDLAMKREPVINEETQTVKADKLDLKI